VSTISVFPDGGGNGGQAPKQSEAGNAASIVMVTTNDVKIETAPYPFFFLTVIVQPLFSLQTSLWINVPRKLIGLGKGHSYFVRFCRVWPVVLSRTLFYQMPFGKLRNESRMPQLLQLTFNPGSSFQQTPY
jgi:hypothetical protein